jgi:hypothetical protein
MIAISGTAIYIWKLVISVANAARPTFAGNLLKSGNAPPMVCRCTGSFASSAAAHSGSQTGSQIGSISGRLAMSSPRNAPSLATRFTSATAASMLWLGIDARPA